jgi:hypothetical protein
MSIVIPNPPNCKPLDEAGNWVPEWSSYFSQISQELQRNYSNQGLVVPELPAATITTLTDASKSTGAILYDSTNNGFRGNISGTWYSFVLI